MVKPLEKLKGFWPVVDGALKGGLAIGMFIELCYFFVLCIRYQGLFAGFPRLIFPVIDVLENESVGMGRDGDFMGGPLSCVVIERLLVMTWVFGIVASIEGLLGLSEEKVFLFSSLWNPLTATGYFRLPRRDSFSVV